MGEYVVMLICIPKLYVGILIFSVDEQITSVAGLGYMISEIDSNDSKRSNYISGQRFC